MVNEKSIDFRNYPLTEKVCKGAKRCVKFFFEMLIGMFQTFIYIFLIIGALASFILLQKLYPEIFNHIIILIAPIVRILMVVANIIFKLFLISITVYFVFFLFKKIEDYNGRLKEERDKRKEDFLNELVDKINKRKKK